MHKIGFSALRPTLMSVGLIALVSLALPGSEVHAQSRKEREDARICARFGMEIGSRGYGSCMLEQQHRRDAKQRDRLEKMALTSQIAKDGQIMAEHARRDRCRRNPDRRECGR